MLKSLQYLLRKRNLSLIIGFGMIATIAGVALLAPVFTSYDPLEVSIPERLEPMSCKHLLGTDPYGRDILSRIMFGSRYSLVIGASSILIGLIVGGILGILAGYYSESWLGIMVLWAADLTMAFPNLILAAFVAVIAGPGTLNTIIALGISFLPRFIRLARATTLSIKRETYIMAAVSLGMSEPRLIFIHLIPNMISSLIVMAVIWMSDAITLEVALSFLGLGVPPPAPSWGTILEDNLKYFQMEPLAVVWPCVVIAWTVQGLNLVGDRFRDILDPRMR